MSPKRKYSFRKLEWRASLGRKWNQLDQHFLPLLDGFELFSRTSTPEPLLLCTHKTTQWQYRPNSQEGVHAMKSVMTTHILVSTIFFCYWPHSSESISKWLLISLHTLFLERTERNTSMTMSCLGNCEVCTIHEHGSVHRFLKTASFQLSAMNNTKARCLYL